MCEWNLSGCIWMDMLVEESMTVLMGECMDMDGLDIESGGMKG